MASAFVLSALMASTLTVPQPRYTPERVALYVAAVADIVTTRIAISKGSHEANPLLAKLVGARPGVLALVAVKAASIAVTELAATFQRAKGHHGYARFLYWITIASWAYASGINLQWAFT